MAHRAGRFVSKNAASGIEIISGIKGGVRIYNTGSEPFLINGALTVAPECSADVDISGLCVISSGLSPKKIEGVYEFIQDHDRIRSGRFKVKAAATIIDRLDEKHYRIFNSGESNIVVELTGSSTSMTLLPSFSIDISTDGEVTVSGAGIEGIYEHLETESDEVRSGRFKIPILRDPPDDPAGKPVPNPMYPHQIIDFTKGGQTAWYRLFNSGETPILLQQNKTGNTLVGVVAAKQSFDFQVGDDDIYVRPDDNGNGTIDPSADNVKAISGSFDYLGSV